MGLFLCVLGTIVVWFVAYGISAAIMTSLSLMAATLLETYAGLRERQTYPLWIIALSLCPAAAFVISWLLAGWLVQEGLYQAVRWGQLVAGALFVPVAAMVFVKLSDRQDRASEMATLSGSLLSDAACCAFLVYGFPRVVQLMQSLG